jgi:hypothetical protein
MADYQMSDADTDQVKATEPVRPWAAALGRGLAAVHEFASEPFGYSNPPGRMVSEAVGIPQAGQVMQDVGYGTTHMTDNTAKGREWRMQAVEAMPTLSAGAKGVGKAAWEAAGSMPNKVPHGQLNLFLIPGPRQAPALAKAAEMEAGGAPPEHIWAETGMLRWTDGSWKYETDDSKAALNAIGHIKETRSHLIGQLDDVQNATRLKSYMTGGTSLEDAAKFLEENGYKVNDKAKQLAGDMTKDELWKHGKDLWGQITGPIAPVPLGKVLSHPELEAEYPGVVKRAKFETFEAGNPRASGQFIPPYRGQAGTVGLNAGLLGEKNKSKEVMMHELQHLHDNLMGLDYGTSPDAIKEIARAQGMPITDEQALELYRLNAGESLARLSQRRTHLSEKERRANFPMSRSGSYGVDVDPKRVRPMEDVYKYGIGAYNAPKE